MPVTTPRHAAAGLLAVVLVVGSGQAAFAGESDAPPTDVGNIEATATTETDPDPLPPPPECWWETKSASNTDRAQEQGFWRQIDGGDHYDDVLVFLEDGTLHRTFSSTQKTYQLQVRVCSDPADERAGQQRWTEVGPPNPTVYWEELTERVTRQVPLPEPDLGFEVGDSGNVEIFINVGLWISVTNADDVVARADVPGAWAETRASLDRIEFVTGTSVTVTEGCAGAGTPLPEGLDTLEQGGCGYTYETVDELGEHTAIIRAIWIVENTTSNGDYQRRPDIVLETPIPIEVFEIQTVGTG